MALKLAVDARRMVMLACCILPTALTNTYYTWPKMLTVGYLLVLYALLFLYRAHEPREKSVVGILAGAAAALAMLSHGGAAFALIGFAIIIVVTKAWPSRRTVVSGAAAFVLLYAPWLAYQRFIDPPGNRLLKWHLAGVKEFDTRSLAQALHDTYGALTLDEYLRGRLANLAALFGDWPLHLQNLFELLIRPDATLVRKVHDSDFYNLLPSLHVFSVALLVALALLPSTPERWERRAGGTMLAAVAATCLVAAILLILPGSTINHQTTYLLQVLLTIFAFFILSKRAPALAWFLIALQLITVATAYGLAVDHDSRFWAVWLAGLAATLALVGYSLAATIARWRQPLSA